MRSAGVVVASLLMIVNSVSASAQTACPVGVAAGSAQCGPSPAEHQHAVPADAPARTRYVPTGEWLKTWGAIASDAKTGDVGVSVDKLTKSLAEKEAMSQCIGLGSDGCAVVLTYRNQCVVIASATVGTGGKTIFQSSYPLEDAINLAMPECTKGKNGESCKVVYSACTKPIFKRY